MKILFLVPALFNSGGIERMTTSLANMLVEKLNCEIDIVVHSKDVKSFFSLDERIQVKSLGLTGRVRYKRITAAKRLRKLLKEGSYSLLFNVDVAMIQIAILARPWSLGVKMVTWEHFSMATASCIGRMKRYVAALLSKHTVVLTSSDRNEYPKCLQHRVCVIPNYTTVNKMGVISGEEKMVLSVGRLETVKGFDLLIMAWKKVKEKFPDWKLVIAGEGSQRNNLQQMISKRNLGGSITLYGATSNIGELYLKSSLYVLPSRNEPFGLVLIEAKSFGLPIVSFDCPYGPKEIVRHRKDGILVEPENVDLLAKELMQLMASPATRNQYSVEALMDYERNWSVGSVLEKWRKIIFQ